jgi:hypothetical protein
MLSPFMTFTPPSTTSAIPPINPSDRKTVKRGLSIDSLYRKHYDKTKSSDFTYTLPEPINKVVSMKIAAIEFPNSWYAFSEEQQSNEFTITLYNTPTPADVTDMSYGEVIQHVIKIPEGNYRSDLFGLCLNNIFSNLRNGLEFIYVDVNEIDTRVAFRTKDVGDDTRNVYLNSDLPENFYFTVDFRVQSDPGRPLFKNAGWMMGFRQAVYEVRRRDESLVIMQNTQFSVQIYNWFLRSESSYGSAVQNYIYLELDDFNCNYTTNTFYGNTMNDTYLGNNIMGRITVSSGMNTIITNTSSDQIFKVREYFGPVKLEKFHVRLLNKYGEPVMLNGNDFSFMLELEILYS